MNVCGTVSFYVLIEKMGEDKFELRKWIRKYFGTRYVF